MKKEIRRKIKEISDKVGTAAAEAESERIIEDLENDYDSKVASGQSELEAYRSILSNTQAIEELLSSMPKTEEEIASEERRAGRKAGMKRLDTVSTVMWLLSVIVYFVVSFKFSNWHISWLIFIYAAIVQAILDMVKQYNDGKGLRAVLHDGLTAVFWMAVVIVYFIVSFAFSNWHISWLIFVAAAIVQVIIDAITKE